MKHLLFSYGGNMHEPEFRQHCPTARIMGAGTIDGYQLHFTEDAGGWDGGVADIRPMDK